MNCCAISTPGTATGLTNKEALSRRKRSLPGFTVRRESRAISIEGTGPNAADRTAGDTAALLPTATTTTGPADHGAPDHVTAREITEFLRGLARIRLPAVGADPAHYAALPARKTELFARIAAQHPRAASDPPVASPTPPTAPEGHAW
jgi:hypothetical protein